ncbi:MAG: hypothetical protein ABSH25_04545 [Syntrophorhabdales bacterium]|jgi:hypothetical protein
MNETKTEGTVLVLARGLIPKARRKSSKPKSFQTHVREHGGVDPGKWVAAGYALDELPLGMKRKRGLGPDEFTEMFGVVIPDVPNGVDSRDHFANAVRDFTKKMPVTIEQHEKAGSDGIIDLASEYERRRMREEAQATSDKEVSHPSPEAVDVDPDFVSEDDYLAAVQN